MKKNCICLISIGREEIFEYSYPTIKSYANKVDADLIVINKKKYNIDKKDNYNYLTFEKNQIYDLFDKYDRILRLDSDIIIKENCPNLFDNPVGKFYCVFEDVGIKESQRRNEIKLIKTQLGQIPNWSKGYFNSGVILCDKEHKEIFDIDIEVIQKNSLGSFKEQNYLNWLVRNKGLEIIDLGHKYNHMGFFTSHFKLNKDDSYILHYAGKQNIKPQDMKNDLKKYFKK